MGTSCNRGLRPGKSHELLSIPRPSRLSGLTIRLRSCSRRPASQRCQSGPRYSMFSSGPIPTPQIVISGVISLSSITLRADRLGGPPFWFGRTDVPPLLSSARV